jgi:hypothetical protein
MRYLLITLLLAVNFWCLTTAEACEHTTTAENWIVSSILQHHCCRLENDKGLRDRDGSERQTPCACHSKRDEAVKTPASIDSFTRQPDKYNSLRLEDALPTHTSVTPPFAGTVTKGLIPVYLLNARLLI